MKHPLAVIFCALIFSLNMPAQKTQDKYSQFRDLFRSECKAAGIVGGSFVFLKDNKIAASEYYGSANLAKNQPVDENTIYHWASNTKPLPASRSCSFATAGLLKLDDPVTKYLPELRAVHNPFGSMDDITIRHLMTHSAGFRNPTWPWDARQGLGAVRADRILAACRDVPIHRNSVSSRAANSATQIPAIIFLGKIIEKLSGDDYEVYIDKNILKPLEMYRTYFDATPYHLLKYRSHSYYIENGKRTEGRFDANTGITVSNSGLNSPLPTWSNISIFWSAIRQKAGGLRRSAETLIARGNVAAADQRPKSMPTATPIYDRHRPDLFSRQPRPDPAHRPRRRSEWLYQLYRLRTKKTCRVHNGLQHERYLPDNTPPEKDVVNKLRKATRQLFRDIE